MAGSVLSILIHISMMISKSPEPEPVQDWVMIIVMQYKYSSTLHPGPYPSIPALLSKPHFIVRLDSK